MDTYTTVPAPANSYIFAPPPDFQVRWGSPIPTAQMFTIKELSKDRVVLADGRGEEREFQDVDAARDYLAAAAEDWFDDQVKKQPWKQAEDLKVLIRDFLEHMKKWSTSQGMPHQICYTWREKLEKASR